MSGVPNIPAADPSLGCNCQYPIGLVVFLIFTTMSLLFCKRKDEDILLRKSSSFDARLFDSTKFIHDRKISLDPRLLEYTQFINSSTNSFQSKSTDLTLNPSFSFDSCPYVTTV